MINRKNNMNQEEYGYFIDIENNMTSYFPDNLKSMSEKYKIRSINKNYHKFNKLNKLNINVNLNIMTTIPEIYENSSHSNNTSNTSNSSNSSNTSNSSNSYTCKKIQCSYDKIAIVILLFVICLKYYYFLHNFV